jgi:excisionase family DNA binding protein
MAQFAAIERPPFGKDERQSGSETPSMLQSVLLNGLPHGIESLLTTKEASQILKIHPKVLERMAKRGDVPAMKVGKFWRYRATTLDA